MLDLRIEMAEKAYFSFVAEADDIALREFFCRFDQRLPARAVEPLDQRGLDLRFGVAADAAARELRRDHLGVVDHQLVAGLQAAAEDRQRFDRRNAAPGRTTSIRAESRGLAGRSAMLSGGKFEVEEVGAHALNSSLLGH